MNAFYIYRNTHFFLVFFLLSYFITVYSAAYLLFFQRVMKIILKHCFTILSSFVESTDKYKINYGRKKSYVFATWNNMELI